MEWLPEAMTAALAVVGPVVVGTPVIGVVGDPPLPVGVDGDLIKDGAGVSFLAGFIVGARVGFVAGLMVGFRVGFLVGDSLGTMDAGTGWHWQYVFTNG